QEGISPALRKPPGLDLPVALPRVNARRRRHLSATGEAAAGICEAFAIALVPKLIKPEWRPCLDLLRGAPAQHDARTCGGGRGDRRAQRTRAELAAADRPLLVRGSAAAVGDDHLRAGRFL